jgi:hypothetical protein
MLNEVIVNLKPFPNKTADQLMSLKNIKAVKMKDVIRNENIDELVTIAMEEEAGFLDMPFLEQKAIIEAIIERDYMEEPAAPVIPSPFTPQPPAAEEEEEEEEEENLVDNE